MRRFYISLKMEFLTNIRSRVGIFFTLIFPMILFLFFGYIFNSDAGISVTGTASGGINEPLWLMPGILTVSIASNGIFGCIPLIMRREAGIFRRVQTTPMPISLHLLARIVIQLVIVVIQVILTLIVGAIAFQAYLDPRGWYLDVAFILTGALVFIAIGQLIATLAPKVDAANVISQLINLTLVFVSNIYIPFAIMPDIVQKIGRVLPGFLMVDVLRPAIILGELPREATINNPLVDLAGLGIYFIVALVISARFFRWI